ncbi:GTP 3',8-cyclase MoaA [Alicyclobacillus contaminans]|uniref:GTP 3',8-cyclase MoaA n=1 Tax=Alicyclobacillus contaminans TaxID=392016 RepID=UPI003CCBF9B2
MMAPRRAVRDGLGRPVSDLRISVTDRCNFRCTYCMPKEVFGADYPFLPHSALLSFEEIVRLVRLFVQLGVRKVRLTGGEPLLRRDLETLVAMIAEVEGIEDMALTTNGSMLTPERARALKAAGLRRVTISLDAMDDAVFQALNDVRFPVSRVLAAMDAAAAAGLQPVKINAVVKRGVNDQQIVPLAEYFRNTGHVLRFIEYMDVGNTNGWRMEDVVPAEDMLRAIHERWPLEPVPPAHPGEVATRYRYLDGAGEIGVIASVTRPFCGGCTRARLSSDGQLFTCLFGSRGHDVRAWLRQNWSDEALLDALAGVWGRRVDRYSEVRSAHTTHSPRVEMSKIGG